MKKILILITAIFLLFTPSITFAIDSKIEAAYNKLIIKLEKKYPVDTQEIILKDLNNRLEKFSEKSKNISLIPIIDELQVLNNEKLYQIWLSLELSLAKQKIQELREVSAFKKTLTVRTLPSYVNNIISTKTHYIETNNSREFFDENDIKRIIYTTYFPLNQSTSSQLSSKSGIIVYDQSGEYRFIEDYSFEKKIPYSELSAKFQAFLTDSHRVSEKNDIFYGYNFLNFRFFQDNYGVYTSSLESSGFDYSTTLLYKREDGGFNFVTDYDQFKIANSLDVFGIPEKHLLLDYLREDAKFETNNISAQLAGIKNLSESLTKGKNRQQSIDAIYAWILGNVEYSRIIDLSDEKIFSGIETFKNGEGVCTGYTKLSSYLFYFAGYHDVEVIKGHVIDAQDFPQIGHAWLKIGDLYYDPTFDDPIGAQNTKQPSDYKYFGLPKDIFYANRYEYDDLPEFLNTVSEEEIRQHIFNKLTALIPKYQSVISDYPVFGEVNFRNTYNIPVSTTINPELLAQKIGSFDVDDNSFRFIENGTQRQITGLMYYPLNSDNTSTVLDFLGYDTNTFKLFNWQTASGTREWRLAYDLEIR